MADLEIVHYPNPSLRERSEEIHEITDEVRAKVRDMIPLMYADDGIGLAAPQVGWNVRLFVMNLQGEEGCGDELVVINPEIVEKSGQQVGEEGCLSLPGVHGDVVRSQRIVLKGQDLDGNELEIEAEDLAARCFQHENDHLNGILFIDKLSPVEKEKNALVLEDLERAWQERSEAVAASQPPQN